MHEVDSRRRRQPPSAPGTAREVSSWSASGYTPRMPSTTLTRPTQGKLIAGVCAGIARRFGVSARQVRVIFVVSLLLPGPQILLYVALWIILPKE